MIVGLLGKKLGMSQVFDESGVLIPVTLIEAGPCPVLQKKTADRDGYNAVQLGFDPRANGKGPKPMLGHLKASGANPPRFVREFRTNGTPGPDVGAVINVADVFKAGDKVDVVGVSKGRGFAGPIKRHHSSRGPETHGSMYHRRTGSIGQSAWPSHVLKGKKMAGRLGGERSTIQNLVVVGADNARNLLIIKGSVPGHIEGYLVIRKAVRAS